MCFMMKRIVTGSNAFHDETHCSNNEVVLYRWRFALSRTGSLPELNVHLNGRASPHTAAGIKHYYN